jgi:hypothetical protein
MLKVEVKKGNKSAIKLYEKLGYYKFTEKENYYDEIRKRGTINCFLPKEDDEPLDGEFLRLICKNTCDEFIFNLTRDEKIGWNIGNSSPLYSGVSNQINFNKTLENSEDFLDLNKHSIQVNSGIAEIYDVDSKSVLRLKSSVGGYCGISADLNNISNSEFDKAITVSPELDYEITFQIRQDVSLEECISFGCLSFDSNNNLISLINIDDTNNNSYFFTNKSIKRSDKYYKIRGIIYKVKVGPNPPMSNEVLYEGFGNNLRFKNKNVCKIIPIIIMDGRTNNPGSSELLIWDYKVRPLVTGYSANGLDIAKTGHFSTGFIQSKNILLMYYKNNNQQLKNLEIEEKLRKYFLPYNSTFKTVNL